VKIRVLVVGRLKEDYFRAAEAEYCKRLRPHCRLEIAEYRDEAALLAALTPLVQVIVLDERGAELSSHEFAHEVVGSAQKTGRELAFLIGGPEGLSEAARRRADRLLAFGRMTIAHRLVRLLLLEQTYRAFTILIGHPYHR
jgi:23S rRNA (pseudouridine1915-N3)-methyltransferase